MVAVNLCNVQQAKKSIDYNKYKNFNWILMMISQNRINN